ncbi:MAG: class II glutamine amidotransferase [Armatimonadota bacterium]
MCGLTGVIASPVKRPEPEMDYIRDLFTRLLVNSEHRGLYATGTVSIQSDGSYTVIKEPAMASEFVESMEYGRLLEQVNTDTCILMGHTRYPTRGSHLDNRNNHPLVSGEPVPLISRESVDVQSHSASIILTHNGHIANADLLFKSTGLRREAQVDSEILLRLAERNVCKSGIDIHSLIDDLSKIKGKLSAVIVSTNRPDQVLLVKGNMPLEVWYHRELRILAYASEPHILGRSVSAITTTGWERIELPPWTVVTVNVKSIPRMRCCRFQCISTVGTGGSICR